jgi:hypothetical protein
MGIETIALIGTAAAGLLSAGIGGYSAYSSSKNKPEEPPMRSKDRMVDAAARSEADLLRKRRGAYGSVLTSPLGVSGNAPTQKATLGD